MSQAEKDNGVVPTRVTYACAECGNHIDDNNEVKVRTYDEGWLPFHPACAPEPGLRGGPWFKISSREHQTGDRKALIQAVNRDNESK